MGLNKRDRIFFKKLMNLKFDIEIDSKCIYIIFKLNFIKIYSINSNFNLNLNVG